MDDPKRMSRTQRFNTEHDTYIEQRQSGLTDLEVMKKMSWREPQLRRHQARAFADGVMFEDPGYSVDFLKNFPPCIQKLSKGKDPYTIIKIKKSADGFTAHFSDD